MQGRTAQTFGHAKAMVSFHPSGQPFEALLDTGSVGSLISMNFLRHHPHIKVYAHHTPIQIIIGGQDQMCTNYAAIDFYFQGTINGRRAMAHIRGEVNVVPELFWNILIGMAIMVSQQIDLQLGRGLAVIGCCGGVVIPLNVINTSDSNYQAPGVQPTQSIAGPFTGAPAPQQLLQQFRPYPRTSQYGFGDPQDMINNFITDFFMPGPSRW